MVTKSTTKAPTKTPSLSDEPFEIASDVVRAWGGSGDDPGSSVAGDVLDVASAVDAAYRGAGGGDTGGTIGCGASGRGDGDSGGGDTGARTLIPSRRLSSSYSLCSVDLSSLLWEETQGHAIYKRYVRTSPPRTTLPHTPHCYSYSPILPTGL